MATQSDTPRLSKLQQQRSRETRERLIEAAFRLWTTVGIDATTIDDICDEAGVSKGGFYFHFARKEDLLLEIGAAASAGQWERWVSFAEGDETTERVARQMTSSIVEVYTSVDRELLRRLIIEVFGAGPRWVAVRGDRKDLLDVMTALVERGQGRGEIAKSYSPPELGMLLVMLMLEGTLTWIATGEASLHAILWRRVDLLLKGAATKPRPRTDRKGRA